MPVTELQIAGRGLQFQKKKPQRIVYRWRNKSACSSTGTRDNAANSAVRTAPPPEQLPSAMFLLARKLLSAPGSAELLFVKLKIAGWLAIGAGLLTLTGAYFFYRYDRNFVDTASKTQGTVIDLVEGKDHDSDPVYYPVFQFQDAQGTQRVIHSDTGTFPPSHEKGDKITVLYSPDDPDHAELYGFWDLWAIPAIMAGVSAFTILFGAMILLVAFFIARSHQRPAAVSVP